MSSQSAQRCVFALTIFVCSLTCASTYAASPQASAEPDSADDRSVSTIFVINSPSSASRGPDSILTFDLQRNSTVLFGAEHNVIGLRGIACDPKKARHIFVSRSAFQSHAAGFFIFNAFGELDIVPSGTAGGQSSFAFDHAGNLYVAQFADGSVRIFKNDVALASLGDIGLGQLAIDSTGTLYLTDFVSARILRIDQGGNVAVFADASKGLDTPYGLAVDRNDDVFVANNPGSSPAFILKLNPLGTATSFATGISVQPGILSMTFDRHHNLYAALRADNTILKFDRHGSSTIFATASDGLDSPGAITVGACPVKLRGDGDRHISKER